MFSEDLTVSQDSVSKLSAWNPELDNWGKSRDEAALQDFYSWEFANQPPLMLFPGHLRQRHGNGMAVVAGVPIQVVPPLPPPLDIDETTFCNISAQSHLAELLRRAKFILWDEVPMMQKHCYTTLKRTLEDLTG
jgi:hypothetical protein